MNLQNELKSIQKRLRNRHLDSRLHLFDSTEAYEQAKQGGMIGENDICIIDNVPYENHA